MFKTIYVAALTIGLTAMPVSQMMRSAAAQSATTTQAKPKKPQSRAQIALHERQKKCGAEWKAAKAAGKVEKGMKWPQYWSACNKRLKAGGA